MFTLDSEKLNDYSKDLSEGVTFACPHCADSTKLGSKCNSCSHKLGLSIWKYKLAFIEPLLGLGFGILAIVAFAIDLSGFRTKTVELIFGFTENMFITSVILLIVIGFALKQFFVSPLMESMASERLRALNFGKKYSADAKNPNDIANCLITGFQKPFALDSLPHEANTVAFDLLESQDGNIQKNAKQVLSELLFIDSFLNDLNNTWQGDRNKAETYGKVASKISKDSKLPKLLRSMDSSNEEVDEKIASLAEWTKVTAPSFSTALLNP